MSPECRQYRWFGHTLLFHHKIEGDFLEIYDTVVSKLEVWFIRSSVPPLERIEVHPSCILLIPKPDARRVAVILKWSEANELLEEV